ncbi:hypothetical protein E3P98_02611 [Wallemia ichthyophaga]|nr:hypothetical protein E3P98_02611 [Wallemia ichthyophaga]
MSQYNVFGGDDSEDDDKVSDQAVTGFDGGVLKSNDNKEKQQPLVIPSQANIDWRDKKKAQRYRPNQEQPVVVNESTATREKLNDGPERVGLQTATSTLKTEDPLAETSVDPAQEPNESVEEQALKYLLSDEKPESKQDEIEAIPMTTAPGISDADAFKEDVAARAEESTMEEYSRVPVEQFGAALLRGMGWKEGTAASRTRSGPTEPYLPDSRPSLLGIGASTRPNNDKDKKESSKDSRMKRQAMNTYRPLTKHSKRSTSPTGPPSNNRSRDYDSHNRIRDRHDDRRDSRRYDDRRESRRDDKRYDDRRYDDRRYEDRRYAERNYDRKRDSYRDDRRYDRRRYESDSIDRSYRKKD